MPPVGLRRLWLDTGEARCKSPACGGSRSGGIGWPRSRRPDSQLLLPRQVTLLQALFIAEQALLRLQQPLLRALRPQALRLFGLQLLDASLQPVDAVLALHALSRKDVALAFLSSLLLPLHTLLTLELALFCLQKPLLRALLARASRLLRLQFLHALLQPIDPFLALHALAGRYLALPILRGLLGLLYLLGSLSALLTLPLFCLLQPIDPLLALLDALLVLTGPLLLRCARDRRGWSARARRCGESRRGRAWRCRDLRHRTRRHGRTLWRCRTERRCGGPRHCRRWCGSGHGGRRCRGSGTGRRRPGPSVLLGRRDRARCNHRDAEKKCCKAKAGRTHDRRYLLTL